MADLGTTTAPQRPDDHRSDPAERQVTRRRTLPGGRAVVGALLITVAVIGVFAAWLSATAAPTVAYAVVDRAVTPGEDVAPGDLRLVPMDLPPEQAARAFTSVDLDGAVALAPLAPGDLLTQSVVRAADDVPGTARFSFELPTAQAMGGNLDSGDRVDILATDDGVTGFVATDVAVIAVDRDGGATMVTVALDEPELVLAVARAADEASLHLASTNPLAPGDGLVRADSFSIDGDTSEDDGGATDAPGDGSTNSSTTDGGGPEDPTATETPTGGDS